LAQVNGLISEAIGSFDSVTVTSETGQVKGTGAQVANTFSLQLNSNYFHGTPACSGAAEPSECEGWQQFIYSNSGSLVVQYWLLFYQAECPSGWTSDGGSDCYKNGVAAISDVPPQNITNLANMSLLGTAASGGNDVGTLAIGNELYQIGNPDSALNLATYWNVAEFNVLGDGYSSEANFSSGTTLVIRIGVDNGTVNYPSCVEGSFTGETNNLNFGNLPSVTRGAFPAVVFTESSSGTASSPCASSVEVSTVTIAETHDFNADGHSDIVWRDLQGDVAMWLMDGKQVAQTANLGNVPTQPRPWTIIGQRDFDGDNKADLLWKDTAGNVAIWFMNGGEISSSASLGTITGGWSIVGTGDFNGDGKGDILWRNSSGGIAIWLMNGSQVLLSAVLGTVPTTWSVAGTGDFNSDGYWDILWRDSAGNVAIWFMNGVTMKSSVGLGTIPTSWTIVGTGDFNGDSHADILWRNTSTGDIAIWLMNGATVLQTGDLGTLSSNWSVAGTGDYNYDSKSDILWRNTMTGDTAMWFMSGVTRIESVDLGTISANTWFIQGAGAD